MEHNAINVDLTNHIIECLKNTSDVEKGVNSVSEAISVGFSILQYSNDELRYLYTKNGIKEIAGYTDDDEIENASVNFILPEDYKRTINDFKIFRDQTYNTLYFRVLHKDKKTIIHIESKTKLIEKNGETYNYFCIYNDITKIKQMELQAISEKKRLALLLEATTDIVFQYRTDTDICIFTSSAFIPLTGEKTFAISDFYNNFSSFLNIHPDDVELWKYLVDGRLVDPVEMRIELVTSPGKYTWLSLHSKNIYDENGVLVEIVGTLTNVDEIKNAERELFERNRRDALTGVLNRTAVEQEIKNILEYKRNCGNMAFMLIDIDNFKIINESLGFLYGDAIIKSLAARLAANFQDAYTGRIGGDEFVVAVPLIENEDDVVSNISELCLNFKRIYNNTNGKFQPLVSVGIAFSRNRNVTYNKLFEEADAALFSAKFTDRGKILSYSEEMSRHLIPASGRDFKEIIPHVEISYIPDKTVIEIFKLLIFTKDSVVAINTVLALLGSEHGFDRIFIYERNESESMNPSYFHWNKDNIKDSEDIISLKEEQFVLMGNYDHLLDVNGVFYTDSVTKLASEKSSIYDVLMQQNITSISQYPIIDMGTVLGFVSFEMCGETIKWTEKMIAELSFVASVIGTTVIKYRSQINMDRERYLLNTIVDHLDLFVYSINPLDYTIVYMDKKLRTTYPEAEYGDYCYSVLRGKTKPCENCPCLGITDKCSSYSSRICLSQTSRWLDIVASKATNFYGNSNIVLTCHDVTNYVQKISSVDSLTSAPTLDAFKRKARILINKNPEKEYMICSINFLKFRYINETYGYQVGNRLLIAFSSILKNSIMQTETYARDQGDKFFLLLEKSSYMSEQDFLTLLNTLKEMLFTELDGDINLNHINLICAVYIMKTKNESVSKMMDKTATAHKNIGYLHTNSCVFYSEQMEKTENKKRNIEANMKKALSENQFKVFLQPKFDFKTKNVIGAEALIRWQKPDGAMIFPDDFIPIFEEDGFIVELDYFVYESVCALIRKWIDSGETPPVISVNVSRAHINDESFINHLYNIVKKYDISTNMLELELTESLFISDPQEMLKIMHELKDLGFIISIDDFGSGYSSLNMLKDFSVDILKLDKSFFSDKIDDSSKIIINSIVNIAKNLNIKVVCEGIETEEIANYLTLIDCDYAQGYLYERPICVQDFETKYIYNKDNLCLQK